MTCRNSAARLYAVRLGGRRGGWCKVLYGMWSNHVQPSSRIVRAQRKDRKIWQHGHHISASPEQTKVTLDVASNKVWAIARLPGHLPGDKCSGGTERATRGVSWPPLEDPCQLPQALLASGGPQVARSSDWRANCSHWQRVATTFAPDFLAAAPLILDPALRASDGFFPTSNLNLKVPASCFPLYQPPKPPTFLPNCPVVNDTTPSQQQPPVPFDS